MSSASVVDVSPLRIRTLRFFYKKRRGKFSQVCGKEVLRHVEFVFSMLGVSKLEASSIMIY